MQCHQIRPYLRDYRSGGLPSFKAAWVAQHLAGCAECRSYQGESERREGAAHSAHLGRAPVAVAAEPFLVRRAGSGAIRRPVPRRVRRAIAMAVLLLTLGMLWLLLQVAQGGWAGERTQPMPGGEGAPPLWDLSLPSPPNRLVLLDLPIAESPIPVTLTRYGIIGDLLQIELSTDLGQGEQIPPLMLCDGSGAIFAPSLAMELASQRGILLQYPVPETLHFPIRLVGDGYLRKYLGPWTIEATVLK